MVFKGIILPDASRKAENAPWKLQPKTNQRPLPQQDRSRTLALCVHSAPKANALISVSVSSIYLRAPRDPRTRTVAARQADVETDNSKNKGLIRIFLLANFLITAHVPATLPSLASTAVGSLWQWTILSVIWLPSPARNYYHYFYGYHSR